MSGLIGAGKPVFQSGRGHRRAWDEARLKENAWYELTGIIRVEPGTDEDREDQLWPYIEVQKYIEVKPPRQTYLYLN